MCFPASGNTRLLAVSFGISWFTSLHKNSHQSLDFLLQKHISFCLVLSDAIASLLPQKSTVVFPWLCLYLLDKKWGFVARWEVSLWDIPPGSRFHQSVCKWQHYQCNTDCPKRNRQKKVKPFVNRTGTNCICEIVTILFSNREIFSEEIEDLLLLSISSHIASTCYPHSKVCDLERRDDPLAEMVAEDSRSSRNSRRTLPCNEMKSEPTFTIGTN